MNPIETIERVNAIISIVAELTEEDINGLLAARERIEQSAEGIEKDERDTAGLTRIDSILAIYSTLPKKE